MGNTTMVSKVIKHVNRDSSSSSYDSKSTSISSQQSTTSLEQEKNVPLRLYSVREKLRSTGFQRSLSDSLQIHGDQVPIRNTTLYGQSGIFGVINGISIPCNQLLIN